MKQEDTPVIPPNLKALWDELYVDKASVETRCETFAMWTLPYICPQEEQDGQPEIRGNVAIGARLVNHLANRIVSAMFPTDRPFFALPPTPEAKAKLAEEAADEVEAAKELLVLNKATASVAADAMRDFDLTKYRPLAVEGAKHLLVTGGAVIRRHADGERTLYGIKHYAITRDMRGNMTSCLLRDSKKFGSLSVSQQDSLKSKRPTHYQKDTPVELYTFFVKVGKHSWAGQQGLDTTLVDGSYDTYTDTNLPVLDLTWTLAHGETYPRGLVEEHAVLFHNVNVTTDAIIDMIGMAADIKKLVDPSSVLDIEELNASARGTYHLGREGDITETPFNKRQELVTITDQVSMWERQLSQAFLLGSGSVRDAERVTAEEVRAFARELESAFGGLYSKLALSWQKREADYLLSQMELGGALKNFDVLVVTGLESMSREGQMDALRLAVADLQMLDSVPEDVRGTIDKRAFAEFVFTNRGILLATFLLSQEQIAANQQAEMQQQQQLMQMQGQADAASAAATQAVQSGE